MPERFQGPSDAELALGAAANGLKAAQRLVELAEDHELVMPAHVAVEWRSHRATMQESLTMVEAVRDGLRAARRGIAT